MEIKKEYAMLLDIQYIKANKRENQLDYLYIIWKDLRDGKKHLNVIPEPVMITYAKTKSFKRMDKECIRAEIRFIA